MFTIDFMNLRYFVDDLWTNLTWTKEKEIMPNLLGLKLEAPMSVAFVRHSSVVGRYSSFHHDFLTIEMTPNIINFHTCWNAGWYFKRQVVTVTGWRLTLSFIFLFSCSCSGLPHRFIWEQSLWQYIKNQTLPFYCVRVVTARLKEGERQHEQLMCIYEETRCACSNRAAQRVTDRLQGRGSVYRWATPGPGVAHAGYLSQK